jgi:hypothetical protein
MTNSSELEKANVRSPPTFAHAGERVSAWLAKLLLVV